MPSFDVVSEVNIQEMDNAVNQALKEVAQRYDFRGSNPGIDFDKTNNLIKLSAADDYKIGALVDLLYNKCAKRGIPLNALEKGTITEATGSSRRVEIKLVMGIETEKAKEIVKAIKDSKMKVQAQIQDEKVRVTGKKRDDLQEAIALLKSTDFKIPLQFENFRD